MGITLATAVQVIHKFKASMHCFIIVRLHLEGFVPTQKFAKFNFTKLDLGNTEQDTTREKCTS